jgi:archaellum component FlaC
LTDRELMEKILKEVSGMKEEISGVKGEISGMKGEISEMKTDIKLIKTHQSEQGEILQAVRHAQEVQTAQNDRLEIEVAQLSGKMEQGFSDVVEVQKALLEMYGEHEAVIRIMRRRSV